MEIVRNRAEISAGEISLLQLFWIFFKIGALSFGGHMSLVAIVESYLVKEKKVLTTDDVLYTVSMASLMPGPLAVNIVTYFGYLLSGWKGALVSFVGILLPAVLLMILLSVFYFNYAFLFDFTLGVDLLLIAVSALILSTGVDLFNKQVKGNLLGILLCSLTIAVNLLFKGLWFNFLLMTVGGLVTLLALPLEDRKRRENGRNFSLSRTTFFCLVGLAGVLVFYLIGGYYWTDNTKIKLLSVFSGMGLTLFGGGFVVIPYMQSLLVDSLHWLSAKEFVYAITLGQITPGPILVNVAFVGYKMAGIGGALLATVAIFLPPALLTVCAIKSVRHTTRVKAVLNGIKPVVIGLIIASGFQLIASVGQLHWWLLAYGLLLFVLLFRFRVNPIYILSFSLLVGFISYFNF
ncbi:chromate efflux transporter [Sphingobacterium sp. LRF_L2]|uniref:chromate efflux transporter n=1 Tax=Sphingobacterium sp. LRF_L2 TaxID=3369421 RepID=UPI003F5E31AA